MEELLTFIRFGSLMEIKPLVTEHAAVFTILVTVIGPTFGFIAVLLTLYKAVIESKAKVTPTPSNRNPFDGLKLNPSSELSPWEVESLMQQHSKRFTPYPILKILAKLPSPSDGFRLYHHGKIYLQKESDENGLCLVSGTYRGISKFIFISSCIILFLSAGGAFFIFINEVKPISLKTFLIDGFAIIWLLGMSIFFASQAGEIIAAETLRKRLDDIELKGKEKGKGMEKAPRQSKGELSSPVRISDPKRAVVEPKKRAPST